MAKGYEQNQDRLRALSSLGKDLARRSRSKCELTGASGVPLQAYEVAPAPAEPTLENTLFLCEDVVSQLSTPTTLRADEWHHLADLVWTDTPVVQVMVLRILRHLAADHPWAERILADAQAAPEVEEWAAAAPLGSVK